MNFLTKTYKLKAVDFVRISKGAMSYVFDTIFDAPALVRHKQAFESFLDTLRLCLTTHFNVDGLPLTTRLKRRVSALHEQVAQTLSLFEICLPLLFFDRFLHILLHVPLAMARWNSCRNFWCFPSERYDHDMIYEACVVL
jgi:hypothetical protein